MLKTKKHQLFKVGKISSIWNKMESAEKLQIPENEKIKKRGFLK